MANLLIFDADYISELTSRMNTACDLMAQAVSSLKSAQAHDNWKCKERVRILEDFDELNLKLGRLDTGINETTRILGGSVSRFAALEQQYESQAENLSDELTSNHGFSASVTHGGSTGAGTSGTPSDAGGAEHAGGHSGHAGHAGHAGHGPGAGVAAGMAGRIPGMGRQNPEGSSSGAEGTAGPHGSMNVNLPVTHIPDNPDAAAKGIKDTQEIAQIAVHSVAITMTQILSRGSRIASASRTEINFTAAAPALTEAYNAGRTIFENSAAIMASPAQPHTTERLAMAAGLVSLAGSTAAGLAVFGQAAAGVASAGAASAGAASESVFRASGSISQNAGNMIQALQGNSEAEEISSVLGAIAGDSSSSGSGSGGESFFDKILSYLKQSVSGGEGSNSTLSAGSSNNTLQSLFSAASVSSSSSSSSSMSASASSPVMEFLGNFVMDQAV